MAGNKRPRKKRTWKPIASNPLIPRDPMQQELPGLVGLEALGKDWFTEGHVYDLLAHADMARRLSKTDKTMQAAKAIHDALVKVSARAAEIGRFGVSGAEMRAIKDNFIVTNELLQATPQQAIWRAAMDAKTEFMKTGKIEIKWN